jgi:hypothetical protein
MKKPIMSKRGRRFDEGGDVEAKMAGLEASNKEAPMGFFERLRAGNIDDPNSEAYKRLGAGRGRAERIPVEDVTPIPKINNKSEGMGGVSAAIQARKNAEAAGELQASGDASVAEAMASKPDQVPSPRITIPTKPASKPAAKEVGPTAGGAKDKKAQAAADEQGDRPKAKVEPATKTTEVKPGPKKEMYRTFGGKMAEKTPDNNPTSGLGDLIGRGAKAVGEAFGNYKFMTPAERIAKENKEKKEARGSFSGLKSGGSVGKASSRADGIAQRGKTRGVMR